MLDGSIPEGLVEREITAFTIVRGDVRREFRFQKAVAYTVHRDRFDQYLVKNAELEGAELWDGTRVLEAREYKEHVALSTVRGKIEARCLIIADGASSHLANALLGGNRKGTKAIGAALECEFRGEVSDALEIHFMDTPTPGIRWMPDYPTNGWLFPTRRGANIGVVGYHVDRRTLERRIGSILEDIKERVGDISPGMVTTHPLPLVPRRRLSTARSLVVGDAAGFVNPLTGEGMTYALTSGKLAAKAVQDNVVNGLPLNRYDRSCGDHILRDLRAASVIGPVLHWLIGKVDMTRFLMEFSEREDLVRACMDISRGEDDWRTLLKHAVPSFIPLFLSSQRAH